MEIVTRRLANLAVQPTIFEGIKKAQLLEPELVKIKKEVNKAMESPFTLSKDGILKIDGCLCLLSNNELRKQILVEEHDTLYFIHLGATKMYQGLKEVFLFYRMNKVVEKYVSKCLIC